MIYYPSFTSVKRALEQDFRDNAYLVHTDKWQSVNISSKPDMAMRELFSASFTVPLRGIEEVEHWQKDIVPTCLLLTCIFKNGSEVRALIPGRRGRSGRGDTQLRIISLKQRALVLRIPTKSGSGLIT